MKYIITEVFFGTRGGIVFNAANDVEVFDHYVSALRFLVMEKRLSLKIDRKVEVDWDECRFESGRQTMVELIEYHERSHTIFTLAKINENGFH